MTKYVREPIDPNAMQCAHWGKKQVTPQVKIIEITLLI